MAEAAYQAVVAAHGGDAKAALRNFVTYLQTKSESPADFQAVLDSLPSEVEAPSGGLVKMPVAVAPAAQRAFDAYVEAAKANEGEVAEEVEIPVGKKCVRNGCSTVYSGPESLEVECVHHPGQAVFHETYKYWSCCDRNKKFDFDEFRSLPGCQAGPEKCVFTEAAAGMKKKAPCRHDFFQVGSTVTINVYAKKVDPVNSTFHISEKQMFVTIYFDGKEFNLNLDLAGNVEPSACSVEIKQPKIEITLKKGAHGGVQGAAWENLGTPIEQ